MRSSDRKLAHLRSGAGWSTPNSDCDSEQTDSDGDGASDDRYQCNDEIGAGGMGRVFAAFDERLGREVALKRLSVGGDEELARRLANEARLTATLEHPNIVPVYDAGVTADGERFYTMRLIRGSSLADAIANATLLTERVSLLPHFVDACQAVAFAHSRGIVHRDIKPANIMVGEFGETHVVDWGLAARSDEVSVGGGTRGYMSPEQAAGDCADERSDIYSLGATLHAMLYTGPPDTVTAHPELAPELAAIARRALAADPGQRYDDAGQLVADLRDYLDGRRVSAYVYSSRDLLRRLVRTWRVPLAAFGIAVVTVAVVGLLSWQQLRIDRNRAIAAEKETQHALTVANETLRDALERQAVDAHRAGRDPEARVLAAHALVRGESAEARGVLAAMPTRSSWAQRSAYALPSCLRIFTTARSDRVLCALADHLLLWDLTTGVALWRRQGRVDLAAVAGERMLLWSRPDGYSVARLDNGRQIHALGTGAAPSQLLAAPDGTRLVAFEGKEIAVVAAPDWTMRRIAKPCGATVLVDAVVVDRLGMVLACRDGSLRGLDRDGQTRFTRQVAFGGAHAPASAMAIRGQRLVIASIDGRAQVVDLAHASTMPVFQVAKRRVAQVEPLRGTALFVLRTDPGVVGVWDLDAGVEIARLPGVSHRAMMTDSKGHVLGLARRAYRGRIASLRSPRVLRAPSGLSSAAVSLQRQVVVAARGDGKVTVWSLSSGEVIAQRTLAPAVVKRLAFSDDGGLLLAAIAGPKSSIVLETTTWRPIASTVPGGHLKRVATIAGDVALASEYSAGFVSWTLPAGPLRRHDSPPVLDIAATANRRQAVVLTRQGDVLQFDGAQRVTKLLSVPGARAVALEPRAGLIAVARVDGVMLVRKSDGDRFTLPGAPSPIDDVAFSPNGKLVVGASRSGSTLVWDTEQRTLIAILRGHTDRVAFAEFASDHLLFTASWDGRVRLWNLRALRASPRELVNAAEAGWTLDLTRAMATD